MWQMALATEVGGLGERLLKNALRAESRSLRQLVGVLVRDWVVTSDLWKNWRRGVQQSQRELG